MRGWREQKDQRQCCKGRQGLAHQGLIRLAKEVRGYSMDSTPQTLMFTRLTGELVKTDADWTGLSVSFSNKHQVMLPLQYFSGLTWVANNHQFQQLEWIPCVLRYATVSPLRRVQVGPGPTAWWVTVHGAEESRTRLSNQHWQQSLQDVGCPPKAASWAD